MRDIGAIRKDTGGDDGALPYIGLARTLLGKVKLQMQLGGLQQYARQFFLPDGTSISVSSRHGQDTVRIAVASTTQGVTASVTTSSQTPVITPPVSEIPSIEIPPIEIPAGTVAAGFSVTPSASTGDSSFIWSPLSRPKAVAPYPGAYSIAVYGLSADGHTVVGDAEGDAVAAGYYAKDGAVRDLGAFDSGLSGGNTAVAYGVSRDGSVVAMQSIYQRFNEAGIWTAQGGLQNLGAGVNSIALGVSADGRYAVGRDGEANAVRWGVNGGKDVLATPGYANGISSDGSIVVGEYIGDGTGVSVPFIWREKGGLSFLGTAGADQATAYAVSDGGGVVVGALATGHFYGISQNRYNINFLGYSAFYWTAKTGVVDLGPGVAQTVTADGTLIGGMLGQRAAVWDLSQKVTYLIDPAGNQYSCVTGLTNTAK